MVTGSGKTAVAQALMTFLKAGDHLLMVDCAYAPTRQLCDRVLSRFGVETTYYDPLIGAAIERLIRPNTRVVFLESPGSLTFEVQDVPAIAEVARGRGVLTMIDNTWATPLYFKPLEHGVDISIHAGTKYICGHSDTMMGVASTGAALYQQLRHGMQDLGAFISPDDCYQGLKGLRTLSVRLERHQANALRLATWLQTRPEVERVIYPALPDDPGHALWRRDFRGACGLFGVLLKPCSDRGLARHGGRPRAVRAGRVLGRLREPDHAQPSRTLPHRDQLGYVVPEPAPARRPGGSRRPDRRPGRGLRASQSA